MHKSIDIPPPPPLAELATQHPLALFLDFDGTLVEIADTPDGIRVPDGVPAQLAGLHRALGGRIAIVSGRAIADIRSHLGPLDLLMVGSHGDRKSVVSGKGVSVRVVLGGRLISNK